MEEPASGGADGAIVCVTTCLLCEENNGLLPYPCRHRLCAECVLKMQAHNRFACPYCQSMQSDAIPSPSYKLLKLLVGVSDDAVRVQLMEAIRSVARREQGALAQMNAAISAAIPFMVDFPSKHIGDDLCHLATTRIVDGLLTVEKAKESMRGEVRGPRQIEEQ